MTDAQTTTDDGSTDGKTTRIIRALAHTDADPTEGGTSTVIDPKGEGNEGENGEK